MPNITPAEAWRTPEVQGLVLILARKLGWHGSVFAFVGEEGTDEAVESALKFLCEHAYAEWQRRNSSIRPIPGT